MRHKLGLVSILIIGWMVILSTLLVGGQKEVAATSVQDGERIADALEAIAGVGRYQVVDQYHPHVLVSADGRHSRTVILLDTVTGELSYETMIIEDRVLQDEEFKPIYPDTGERWKR